LLGILQGTSNSVFEQDVSGFTWPPPSKSNGLVPKNSETSRPRISRMKKKGVGGGEAGFAGNGTNT